MGWPTCLSTGVCERKNERALQGELVDDATDDSSIELTLDHELNSNGAMS